MHEQAAHVCYIWRHKEKETGLPLSKKCHMNNSMGGTSGPTSTTREEPCHMEAVANEQSLGRHQRADEDHWNAQWERITRTTRTRQLNGSAAIDRYRELRSTPGSRQTLGTQGARGWANHS